MISLVGQLFVDFIISVFVKDLMIYNDLEVLKRSFRPYKINNLFNLSATILVFYVSSLYQKYLRECNIYLLFISITVTHVKAKHNKTCFIIIQWILCKSVYA